MKSHLECLSCFCRQTLEAVRFVTDDIAVQEQALRSVLKAASEMDLRVSPPEMGRYIHHMIRDLTGDGDPYRKVKRQFNEAALELCQELEGEVAHSRDPLETAVRFAAAGNIIDFGAKPGLDREHASSVIRSALTMPLVGGGLNEFREAIERAGQILYLGDNAGEIVFDRLLIEQLPRERITYVVKAHPIINDATMEDARATGMTGLVEVIDNGGDAPGTILEQCSAEFRERFENADLIVAKGQGNYETLSEAPRDIFFLLMAKCAVIASDIGCETGSLVLLAHTP